MTREALSFTHRFIPAKDPRHARTLLLLHGTGGNEDDLLPLGTRLDPEANMLSPRGKILENGMPRFFRRFAEGVFDIEDLKNRTHELADFIHEAAETYALDRGRVTAVGYSNGANIAASMLLLRPDVLAGAVLFRAMLPFEPDLVPALEGKPVLLLGGTADSMMPRQSTERLAEILRGAGAAVTLSWQQAGHRLTDSDFQEASAFLRQHA